MKENRDIAFYGSKYHGQYHFSGRLERPIAVIPSIDDLRSWAESHQNACIIVNYDESASALEPMLTYHYPYKGQNVGLLSAKALLENPELESVLKH